MREKFQEPPKTGFRSCKRRGCPLSSSDRLRVLRLRRPGQYVDYSPDGDRDGVLRVPVFGGAGTGVRFFVIGGLKGEMIEIDSATRARVFL